MVDFYTKFVLSVIAVSLAVLAGDKIVAKSYGYGFDVPKVQICDNTGACASMSEVYFDLPGTGMAPGTRLRSYALDTYKRSPD